MAANSSPIRIGIYGCEADIPRKSRACGLWPAGYASAVEAAGGVAVHLRELARGLSPRDILEDVGGMVLVADRFTQERPSPQEERLIRWCQDHRLPLLGVDHGLHFLNNACGGSVYLDLPRDLPEALQHRHPPEPGLRHAITVVRGTRLAHIYGEGEIVVNSEHRRAVQRVARGFRVSAQALDGVIEAIEAETDGWFALGVQWHPASVTASGLDIQLFRGLVEACRQRAEKPARGSRHSAA
jgi:putative glutamine amidotransferase